MKKHELLFPFFAIWLLSCSNEETLHGIDSTVQNRDSQVTNATADNVKPEPKPELEAEPEQEPVPEPVPEPEPTSEPEPEVKPEPISQVPLIEECKEDVDYDPSDFMCSLPVSEDSIWDIVTEWKNREDQLIDRDSSWISAAPVNNNYCASIPQSDQLIFVSNFTITSDMNVRIQSIIDNYGTVMIWKDADPLKSVYKSEENVPWVNDDIQIKSGFYSVIVDSIDTGGASGIVFSLINSDSRVSILNSNSAAEGLVPWCMFRRSSESDKSTTDFVRDVSSCRPCLIGNKSN